MSRADTERIHLIWWVRGTLGARGHLALAAHPVNPAENAGLRRILISACNWFQHKHEWADERGLIRHAPGQLVDEPPAQVCTWDEVWALISPGITAERIAELNAAWRDGADDRARRGEHCDERLHLAVCAFYKPVPVAQTFQLDLFDLIGAGA